MRETIYKTVAIAWAAALIGSLGVGIIVVVTNASEPAFELLMTGLVGLLVITCPAVEVISTLACQERERRPLG